MTVVDSTKISVSGIKFFFKYFCTTLALFYPHSFLSYETKHMFPVDEKGRLDLFNGSRVNYRYP